MQNSIQVTAPPATPHETGNELSTGPTGGNPTVPPVEASDIETPETETPETETPATEAPETETPDPAEQELQDIAKRADELRNPEITAPPESEQPNTEQGGTPELTLEQKVNWIMNTMYDMQQAQQGNSQQTPPGSEETTGAADIYNEAFGAPEQPTPPNPEYVPISQFNELVAQFNDLQHAYRGLQEGQTTIQDRFSTQDQKAVEATKIADIQREYNLSAEDATRVHDLFNQGEYGAGLKYARGRSQLEVATNDHYEQRAQDRALAGRPSVPGGRTEAPEDNTQLIEQKYRQMETETDPEKKEEILIWLIENGGMDLLRRQSRNIASEAGRSRGIT